MLKLVPFNHAWITHDKIDIHAIYRRPRFVVDEFGELEREVGSDGLPTWDLTGPLPVRSHNRWVAKGFEYVTLANRESLAIAAKQGTLIGGSFADYNQHASGGPWNYRLYAATAAHSSSAELAQIADDVKKYGADAVEELRRRAEPGFRLPDALRKQAAPRKGKDEAA